MPKKVHNGPTMVFPTRIEIKTMGRLERLVRQLKSKVSGKLKNDITRNALVIDAIEQYLTDNLD